MFIAVFNIRFLVLTFLGVSLGKEKFEFGVIVLVLELRFLIFRSSENLFRGQLAVDDHAVLHFVGLPHGLGGEGHLLDHRIVVVLGALVLEGDLGVPAVQRLLKLTVPVRGLLTGPQFFFGARGLVAVLGLLIGFFVIAGQGQLRAVPGLLRRFL